MRLYIPYSAGLGASDVQALRRLSTVSLRLVADELSEPGSHEAVRWILRQPDPELALRSVISENVRHAVHAASLPEAAGVGELGKSFWKKFVKFNRRIFNAVKRVNAKVAKIDPIYKATAKVRKKVMNIARKEAPLIITAVGAVVSIAVPVLAPFMPAIVGALSTAYELRAAKINAAKAVKAGKAEANQMQAQVAQQEAQANQQADQVYTQAQTQFQAAGWDQASWNALSIDQKANLIQGLQSGQLPVNPAQQASLIAAQNAAQQQIQQSTNNAAASSGTAAATSGGGGGGGGGDGSGGTYTPPPYVPTSPPIQGPVPSPVVPSGIAPPAPVPTSGGGSPMPLLLAGGGLLALLAMGSGKKGKYS